MKLNRTSLFLQAALLAFFSTMAVAGGGGKGAVADLSITKTDGQTNTVPGALITYTIVVSNAGPSDVSGALVTDVFPAGFVGGSWTCVPETGSACTAGPVAGDIADNADILAGSFVTYTAVGNVDIAFIGTLSNVASVVPPGGITDPDGANDAQTDGTTVAEPFIIPTLNVWGLLALIALVGGIATMRRRRALSK